MAIAMNGSLRLMSMLCGWWLAGALLCAAEHAPSASAGWPQLRGPQHNGFADSTPLADRWPAAGPPVLWMRRLGQGYSSFAVRDGLAYTQMQNLLGHYLVCLDVETGRTLWEHRYDAPYEPASIYPGPRATPTVSGERVYFVSPAGRVRCLSLDGSVVHWSVDLDARFGLRGLGFGYAASPLVLEDKVILPAGGSHASLVALGALDGRTLWQVGDEAASYATPLPIRLGGRQYVIAFLQNSLLCVDPTDGRSQWDERYSQGYDEHSAFPLYEEPLLVIASPFRGGAMAYRLTSPDVDSPDARVHQDLAWQSGRLSNDVASSLLINGQIYGFDLRDAQSKAQRPSRGEYRCLDAPTGDVRWSSSEPGHSSAIAADGKLVLFNDRGEVLLLRQNPMAYEELARTRLFADEICWTSPALSEGRLLLRTQKWAACVYLGQPAALDVAQASAARPASEVARSPSPFDFTALLQGEREHPFERPDGPETWRWYLGSLGAVFLPAALMAGALWLTPRTKDLARRAFWPSLMLWGVAATPLINRHAAEFVFTWPAALFAVYQVTLMAIIDYEVGRRSSPGMPAEALQRPRRRARLAGVLFLTTCVAYFLICRRLSLAHEIAFLFGFLPSFPVAAWAAWRMQARRSLWVDIAWSWLAFSFCFWTSALLLFLRDWTGT